MPPTPASPVPTAPRYQLTLHDHLGRIHGETSYDFATIAECAAKMRDLQFVIGRVYDRETHTRGRLFPSGRVRWNG